MPWSRKQSCDSCRASKARCNKATPNCSRCAERHLRCVYDRRDTARATPYPFPPISTSRLQNSAESSSNTRISSELECDPYEAFLDDQPFSLITDAVLPDFDHELGLSWNSMKDLGSESLAASKPFRLPNQDSQQPAPARQDGFMNSARTPKISADLPPEDTDSSNSWFQQSFEDEAAASQSKSRMTITIEQPTAQRTLMRRGVHKACPLTSAVLGLIVSYPKMMVEGDRLPPFIQPPCHIDEELAQDCAESGKHICLPKDLAVCASLVGMFYERTASNAAAGWNYIYAEGERLRQEYSKLAPEERLATLQCVTIFLILQATHPGSAAENGGVGLLTAVTDMVMDLTRNYDWHLDLPPGRPDRREWVFRESVRRILVLVGIIDLLLEGIIVGPATSCHDFRAAPLPSNRDLWDARTNRKWRAEYARYLSRRTTKKVLTVRDLIESDEGGCFTNSRNNSRNTEVYPDVVTWCEGLDALGTLIWMVMPFEQHRSQNLARVIS